MALNLLITLTRIYVQIKLEVIKNKHIGKIQLHILVII